MINLGVFQNKSGEMLITDPCYEKGTWCQGAVVCEPGEWEAFVIKKDAKHWGNRCAELIAVKKGYDLKEDWKGLPFDLGVDSGQLGFFDADLYNDDFVPSDSDKAVPSKISLPDDNAFYKVCCNVTLSDLGAGVISTGAVSRSGFGDGSYTGYIQEHKDQAVAIKVVFIGDEGEDDEF